MTINAIIMSFHGKNEKESTIPIYYIHHPCVCKLMYENAEYGKYMCNIYFYMIFG